MSISRRTGAFGRDSIPRSPPTARPRFRRFGTPPLGGSLLSTTKLTSSRAEPSRCRMTPSLTSYPRRGGIASPCSPPPAISGAP
jgi:hypothetical protein